METYINPQAIKDASIPISKVAAMSDNERLAFVDSLRLSNINGETFLTEAPDDGKVYARTHGEWVNVDFNWELIETITLGEGVTVIQKSTEPNGNAYAFKNIAVVMYNVADSSWKNQILFTVTFNKNIIKCSYSTANTLSAFRDNCYFNLQPVKMMFHLINTHNILQIGITNPISNPSYLNGYPDLLSSDIAINNVGAVISKIQISLNNATFLANTKFDIYAIR